MTMQAKPSRQEILNIKEAATICREAARHIMGIQLQLDEVSIMDIDGIISRAWPDGPTGNPEKDAYRYELWGCFLGEALCVALDGRWVKTANGLGVSVGGEVVYPVEIIEQRFVKGMAHPVSDAYMACKQKLIDLP